MRTSLFIVISAVFLVKIVSSEKEVSQQADQLTGDKCMPNTASPVIRQMEMVFAVNSLPCQAIVK